MVGSVVRILVEVPRYGFVKRELHGAVPQVDYVSPVPCPFNYGCIPDQAGAEGDPADVVLLGPRVAAGTLVEAPVRGVVRFVDAGLDDPKWIASAVAPTHADKQAIAAFFRVYAVARAALNFVRGRRGRTAYLGIELEVGGAQVVASASNLAEARLVHDTLAAAGLHPRIRGEHRPSYLGEIPVPDARVEVFVPTIEAPEARALLLDLEQAAARPPWTCDGCGEENPGNFAECWRCQRVRRPQRDEA